MNAVSGSGSSAIAKPIRTRLSTMSARPVSPRWKAPWYWPAPGLERAHQWPVILSARPAGRNGLPRHAAHRLLLDTSRVLAGLSGARLFWPLLPAARHRAEDDPDPQAEDQEIGDHLRGDHEPRRFGLGRDITEPDR